MLQLAGLNIGFSNAQNIQGLLIIITFVKLINYLNNDTPKDSRDVPNIFVIESNILIKRKIFQQYYGI